MPSWLFIRLGAVFRALLIAFWAVSATFAPAHATMDALEDPCHTAASIDSHASAPGDLDQKFHAVHDCGTCHVHVLPAPTGGALKPAIRGEARVLADARGGPSARADGPFRPPRA